MAQQIKITQTSNADMNIGVHKNLTAVKWLEDNLIGNPFSEKDFAHNVNVFQQAKEMEKRQMEELALYIYEYSVTCLEERINPDGKKKFEQYYNETF